VQSDNLAKTNSHSLSYIRRAPFPASTFSFVHRRITGSKLLLLCYDDENPSREIYIYENENLDVRSATMTDVTERVRPVFLTNRLPAPVCVSPKYLDGELILFILSRVFPV
jgi:hypothetical protein